MAGNTAKYPNRLRVSIKQAGLTVKEVAQETGIPLRTLFDYCKGDVPIPRKRVEDLATMIGCLPHDLVIVPPRIDRAPEERVHDWIPKDHLDTSGLFASSVTPMVQLSQTQQMTLPEMVLSEQGRFTSSEQVVLLPPVFSLGISSLEIASCDIATWFGARVNDLKAIGSVWHGATVTYQQQQADVHAELENWNSMVDQDHQPTNEYLISRRMALATLATLPTSLLIKVQTGPLTALVMQEFLTQCATSITTCWALLNGDGLTTVEYSLSKYLPLLIALAQKPSKNQKTAAYLASQGCLIMCLACYHRLRFQEDLAYARHAVMLANISGDQNLLVYAQIHLAGALGLNGQGVSMVQKQEEAALHLNEVVQPLQSKVLTELALSYAQHGQAEKALCCISKSHDLPLDTPGEIPGFITADSGSFQLTLFEGMTHLALAQCDTDHAQQHSARARTVLAQFEKQVPQMMVPERSKIEIINHQAMAAIGIRNLDEFEHYFLAGASGAKVLGSEKRKSEVIANWKTAWEQWPHEKRILELADVLF